MINDVSTKKIKIRKFWKLLFLIAEIIKLKEEFIRITDLGFRFASKLNGS